MSTRDALAHVPVGCVPRLLWEALKLPMPVLPRRVCRDWSVSCEQDDRSARLRCRPLLCAPPARRRSRRCCCRCAAAAAAAASAAAAAAAERRCSRRRRRPSSRCCLARFRKASNWFLRPEMEYAALPAEAVGECGEGLKRRM